MTSHRFYTLDAMRGIAAIAVVVFHLTQQFKFKPEPYAFLAVDFFFMLSGFVLANAYEKRLRDGMTASKFMKLRIVRLYPMFALGSLLGVVTLISQNVYRTGHSLGWLESVTSISLNIVAIPSPASPYLFPINPPGWSLFLEFVVNGLFAWVLFRISTKALFSLLIAMAAIFSAALFLHGDMDVGVAWPTLAYAIVRITFAFLIGVVFAKWGRRTSPLPSATSAIALLLLIIVLCLPINGNPNPVFNLAAVLMLLPFLLWLGIHAQLPNYLFGFGAALGDLSYPLYAVHFPIMRMASFAGRISHISPLLFSVIFLAVIIPASWLLARFVDAPIRNWWRLYRNHRGDDLQAAMGYN
jgi:peptidoglycan/LPS O-acetylase OafA/YrhL